MKEKYLGLDLGTKTCGVSIANVTKSLIFPVKTIRFNREDYDACAKEVEKIIKEKSITDVVIGLPKNMDGSLGFATDRTLNFIPKLENMGVKVHTVDERLTSVEAERLLHDCDLKSKEFKDRVDMEAAILILESYLRSLNDD